MQVSIPSSHLNNGLWFEPNHLTIILKFLKKLDDGLLEVKTCEGEKHMISYDKEFKTWNISYCMKIGEALIHQKKNPRKYIQTIDPIVSIEIKRIGR